MPTATITASHSRVTLALAAALVLAATFALWAYYGTDVFFEIVRTGWALCF